METTQENSPCGYLYLKLTKMPYFSFLKNRNIKRKTIKVTDGSLRNSLR
jgi:hypothetical protein